MNQVDVAAVNAKLHEFLRLGMTRSRSRRLGSADSQRVNDVHRALCIGGVLQRLAVHVKHQGLGLVLAVPGPLAHKLVLALLRPGDVQGDGTSQFRTETQFRGSYDRPNMPTGSCKN